MNLPEFGVRKPVVANLVMFAILGAGLIFGGSLRKEFFPEVDPGVIVVSAPYPGASPDEVEQALAKKIEDRVADLDDVDEVTSVVSEGAASVTITFETGVDIDLALQDVKREVDALQDLPAESDRIIVDKVEPNLPTINISLFGDTEERVMKDAIRTIRDDLQTIDGMGDMVISGVRRDEILVEIRPSSLIEHGLSISQVAERVRADMQELPGGTVKGSTATLSIRTLGSAERADEIRNIVIKAGGDGSVVRLGQIAEVTEGFADQDIRSRLNGVPAYSITVYKVGKQDAVEIAALVKAYGAGLRGDPFEPEGGEKFAKALADASGNDDPINERERAYRLGEARAALGGVPDGASVAITTDLAKFIVGRLDLLTRNAFWGGILVFITLVLLLNWRISFWVALGLIVSLLGALTVMYFIGVTLNLLTMFGLIVVIGLLVDDAIVVAENIAARHESGEPALTAAIRGTSQVAWPVVATVMTTICAFLPLAIIQGQIGDFLGVLPVVVACALGVSLIECLFIMPSHMAHSLVSGDKSRGRASILSKIERAADRYREAFFQKLMMPLYEKSLRIALRFRYAAIAASVAVALGTFGLVAGGMVEFIFFETNDAETINGELRMPIGTAADITDEYLQRIERACLNQPEITAVFATTGALASLEGDSSSQAGHVGQVILEVLPVEQREEIARKNGLGSARQSDEIITAIYNEVGPLPGSRSFRLSGVAGGPDGPALTYTVTGDNDAVILPVIDKIKQRIASYPGTQSIADDADRGQRELRITLRDGASELGFTTAGIAQQVRGYVFGLEPYTFAGDREDVDVRVTLPQTQRRSIADLERQYIFSPAGQPVPLSEVAYLDEVEGYATIRRLDRDRAVTVTADVDRGTGANPDRIAGELDAWIASELSVAHPAVEIAARGRQKENAESFATLPIGMAVAAGLIYVILAWLFSSYVQPLVVMSAIPFATIGMIFGHLILGYSLTFLSLIGFVALTGVVVNDSLIFMEFFNERRRAGMGVFDACIAAGRARFRAILLTTVTTVLGLSPLMLEKSFQAKFLIPMAITISGGLVSATVIILVVLPCMLMVLRDLGWLFRAVWTGTTPPPDWEPKAAGADPEDFDPAQLRHPA